MGPPSCSVESLKQFFRWLLNLLFLARAGFSSFHWHIHLLLGLELQLLLHQLLLFRLLFQLLDPFGVVFVANQNLLRGPVSGLAQLHEPVKFLVELRFLLSIHQSDSLGNESHAWVTVSANAKQALVRISLATERLGNHQYHALNGCSEVCATHFLVRSGHDELMSAYVIRLV